MMYSKLSVIARRAKPDVAIRSPRLLPLGELSPQVTERV